MKRSIKWLLALALVMALVVAGTVLADDTRPPGGGDDPTPTSGTVTVTQ